MNSFFQLPSCVQVIQFTEYSLLIITTKICLQRFCDHILRGHVRVAQKYHHKQGMVRKAESRKTYTIVNRWSHIQYSLYNKPGYVAVTDFDCITASK